MRSVVDKSIWMGQLYVYDVECFVRREISRRKTNVLGRWVLGERESGKGEGQKPYYREVPFRVRWWNKRDGKKGHASMGLCRIYIYMELNCEL